MNTISLFAGKAVAVIAFIAEGVAVDATVFAPGLAAPGRRPSDAPDEEGIIGVSHPKLGYVPLIVLDVDQSEFSGHMVSKYRAEAQRLAEATGKRIECVRFGDRGREHVEWVA